MPVSTHNDYLVKFFVSIASFLAYLISFKLTQQLPEMLMRDGWIYLIFLPAGTKLICIMLFGVWGTIGDFFALLWMATSFMVQVDLSLLVLYAFASSSLTFLAIRAAMTLLRISVNLNNLKYMQIPLLSLLSSGIHGAITMLLLVKVNIVNETHLIANSLAMTLGDFLGTFIVLTVFMIATRFIKANLVKKNI
jgi:hypothetical protein